jgi:uncharacterized protein YjbI with pentapeptide repeats
VRLNVLGGDRTTVPENIDPYELGGLEKSLNDSATRASTIWISYLLFGIYLLIAAGTTNHRQLLVEDSFKLPVLSSEVPLKWFFTLSPLLFVLLHFYVLLQVLLLGRTASAYNRALDQIVKRSGDNAMFRQRLANTLFAQLFAGSPRERKGWLGSALRVIAWITLVAAPIYVAVVFQIVFLPYHSHLATWTHRLLVFAEVAAAFALWPLVLDGRKDLSWLRLRRQIRRVVQLPSKLLTIKRSQWRRLRLACGQAGFLVVGVLMVVFSILFLSFPGEPLANILTFNNLVAVRCDRWISQNFDHLAGPFLGVIDPEKLKRKQDAAQTAGLKTWQGDPTRDFSSRDLACGRFEFADLSGANLEGARLTGAKLDSVTLEFANLRESELQMADLTNGKLKGTNFARAQARGAILSKANLQEATLANARFQGADFSVAILRDADLTNGDLQGANLIETQLQGATLSSVYLEGASLQRARLAGAVLTGVHLMGADLSGAQLQGVDFSGGIGDLSGASFRNSWLQGAELEGTFLKQTVLADTFFWRAVHANCVNASVTMPRFDEVIEPTNDGAAGLPATKENIEAFIGRISNKAEVTARLRKTLLGSEDHAGADQLRKSCVGSSESQPTDDLERADFIATRVCQLTSNRKEVAAGIIRNWYNRTVPLTEYFSRIAQKFIACLGPDELGAEDRALLIARQEPS